MSNWRLIILLFALSSSGAASVINFETLPTTYMYLGGGQNIGSYYGGVTFGPNVTGLDLSGSTAFPPHSGSITVWDPVDLTVTISFNTPQNMFGIWYTSFDFLGFSAFDGGGNFLSSVVGPANTDGTTGGSGFISLTVPGISSIDLAGSPGAYVFDDVTFSENGNAVPEPPDVLLLLSAATLLLAGRARHKQLR